MKPQTESRTVVHQSAIAKGEYPASSASLPTVSFVITSYNNKEFVHQCLDSIRAQDYPRVLTEIVVADGGSLDGTVDLCHDFGARVVFNGNRTEKGFDGGKTLGINAAQNEIVILLDADNILGSPAYVREILQPFVDQPEVVAVSPIITAKPEWKSFERYAAYAYDPFDFNWTLTCEERTLQESQRDARFLELRCKSREKIYVGNGTAARRGVLLKVGGYDFDLETGKRVYQQGKMLLSTRAILFHHNATCIKQLVRKKIRQARDLSKSLPRRERPNSFTDIVLPNTREGRLKIVAQVTGNLSLALPAAVAAKEFARRGDTAMMWHVLMAPLVTLVYCAILLAEPAGRGLVFNVLCGRASQTPDLHGTTNLVR